MIRITHYNFYHFEFLSTFIKFIPLVTSITGLLLAYLSYEFFYKTNYFKQKISKFMFFTDLNNSFIKYFLNLYSFLINKWYIDYFFIKLFIRPFLFFSYQISYKNIDAGILYLLQPDLAKSFY